TRWVRSWPVQRAQARREESARTLSRARAPVLDGKQASLCRKTPWPPAHHRDRGGRIDGPPLTGPVVACRSERLVTNARPMIRFFRRKTDAAATPEPPPAGQAESRSPPAYSIEE